MKTKIIKLAIAASFYMGSGNLVAQNYYGGTVFAGVTNGAINKTPTGYDVPVTSGGSLYRTDDYRFTGSTVTYETLSPSHESWDMVDTVGITGALDLSQYLSTVITPEDWTDLSAYTGSYTVSLTGFSTAPSLDVGEHHELRSSLDGFSSSLVRWDYGVNATAAGVFFNPSYVDSNFATTGTGLFGNSYSSSTLVSTDSPLELRFYHWYDTGAPNIDGDPSVSHLGADSNVTFSNVVSVPEPSSSLLLALVAFFGMRRKR